MSTKQQHANNSTSTKNGSNYKQVANVNRRTWDKESYAKRAQDRQEKLKHQDQKTGSKSKHQQHAAVGTTVPLDYSDRILLDPEIENEEFTPAISGAAGPEGSQRAFLKARKNRVHHIDDKIGSSEIISIEAATKLKGSTDDVVDDEINDKKKKKKKSQVSPVQKIGIGWHCTVCDCFLKDSHTYLDHINGRKHQRALGYSMRVERSSKDQVLEKLQQLTNDKQQQSTMKDDSKTHDWNQLVNQKDEEERIRKEERQRKRKERRNKTKGSVVEDSVCDDEVAIETTAITDDPRPEGDIEEIALQNDDKRQDKDETHLAQSDDEESIQEEINPDIAAMMGFTGFGTSSR
jgi:U4/U6.U5 tri-snRNP component SNU23